MQLLLLVGLYKLKVTFGPTLIQSEKGKECSPVSRFSERASLMQQKVLYIGNRVLLAQSNIFNDMIYGRFHCNLSAKCKQLTCSL